MSLQPSRSPTPARSRSPRNTGGSAVIQAMVLAVVLAVAMAVALAVALAPDLGPAGAPALAAPPPAAEDQPRAVGVWPLRPRPEVVRGFDPPADEWGAGHRGVDLAGAADQPVRAAMGGAVSWVGRLAGRGVVVVDHGDTRTTYEPVTSALAVGDRVAAGARLGVLELIGSHCFPEACLHWGWLRGEAYLDPLLLVGAGRVRLLPPAGLDGVAGRAGDITTTAARVGAPLPPLSLACQARGWACW